MQFGLIVMEFLILGDGLGLFLRFSVTSIFCMCGFKMDGMQGILDFGTPHMCCTVGVGWKVFDFRKERGVGLTGDLVGCGNSDLQVRAWVKRVLMGVSQFLGLL